MVDVIIIGCGIVGAAAAYRLSRCQASVLVLEKENDVACGTTKANSAIIHAGYDPRPGTLMAKCNVEGSRMAARIFRELDVPYKRCGSMVVAFAPGEMETLQMLYKRGVQNGVEGMRLLDGAKARQLEPQLSEEVVGALLAPSAMIVSPWEYALALAETAVKNGVTLRRQCPVTAIAQTTGGWRVTTPHGDFECRFILNAAGVHADEIHNMAASPAFCLRPDRGEYHLLDKSEGERVGRIIFQCPTKAGKGTLVAPTVHGNLIVGPNNETPFDKDDVATTAEGLAIVARRAKKSVPALDLRQNIRQFAGNRAVAETDDFIIAEAVGAPGFIDLAAIKSPGLSAAPAIAEMAVELLQERGLVTTEKTTWNRRRTCVRFAGLSPAQKARLVQENPAYGRIICRCEMVTEGEIANALAGPIPPLSVDGVKRRCNAGMGRCQGGFCGPRIAALLAAHQGLPPDQIPQDKAGSFILTGETKGGGTHDI